MKTRTRILTAIPIILLLLLVVACGQNSNDATTSQPAANQPGTPSAAPAPEAPKPEEPKKDPNIVGTDKFPTKDIEFVVPYNPGGGYDTWARGFAEFSKKYLPEDVNVVVSNKPGGAGRSGTSAIYRARPDGYTIGIAELLLAGPQIVLGPDEIGFDLRKFTWIGQFVADPYVVAVSTKSGINSMADLKAKGQVRWGLATISAPDMITIDIYDIDASFVSGFGGIPEQIAALSRGDVDMVAAGANSLYKFVESGEIKPILSTYHERAALYPDAPTIKEETGENTSFAVQRTIAGPPGIPAEEKQVLEDLFNKVTNDADFQAWVKEKNYNLDAANSAELTESVNILMDSLDKYKDSFVPVLKDQLSNQ